MNPQFEQDIDQKLLVDWLAVVGMMTMFWSPVERHIDQCVHILTNPNTTKKKPTRLGSKLEFIKTNIFSGIIGEQDIQLLSQLTKDASQIRDVLVHGVINYFDKSKMEVGKIDGTKKGHHIEIFTIDRARLDKSAASLIALQKQWESIVNALYERSING